MTLPFHSDGRNIPVLIDSMGSAGLYIELRVFSENGCRCGAVNQIIDRKDAKRLAEDILKWLEETKEII